MELGISGVIGLLFGSVLAWLALRSRTARLEAQLSLREKELTAGKADLARLLEDQRALVESRARLESALESERKTNDEKIELLTKTGQDLQNAFKALASDALRSNNSSFLQIAQETLKRFQSEAKGDLDARQKAVADLVTPVRESLDKVDAQIQQMEKERIDAYGGLRQQVDSLITSQKELQSETGNLVRALRTPNVRGRWGEIQLRRVVEIAGMLPYCDFTEQETITGLTEAGSYEGLRLESGVRPNQKRCRTELVGCHHRKTRQELRAPNPKQTGITNGTRPPRTVARSICRTNLQREQRGRRSNFIHFPLLGPV